MGKVTKIILHLAALAVLGGGLMMVLHPNLLNKENAGQAPAAYGELQDIPSVEVANSPYYKKVDVYNLVSQKDRIVLPRFRTRQQRTEFTCGPVAAMMVVDYYLGECHDGELEIAKIMGTHTTKGTTISGMAKYFNHLGWDVVSSEGKKAPDNYEDFIAWVRQNLQKKTPIIVENVDWGGHYRVIIGYDGMGSDHQGDDVLMMADPYDTTDHTRDGYNIVSAERFFYMWFDHQLFEKSQQSRPYIIAKPK